MNYAYQNPPPGDHKQQLITMVRDRKIHSEKENMFFYQRLPVLYQLYRGTMRSRAQTFRNNVHIPLIFTTIQSDVARKVETLFSSYPVVTFAGYGPDDASFARKQEALVSAQFEDTQLFRKSIEVFLSADLYGTAVIQFGWETKTRDIVISDVQTLPLSGETIRTDRTEPYTDFDGPVFENIDLLDFFPQPGKKTIDEMQWVIVRRWMDLDDIENLASQGIYNPSEVARLKREGGSFEDTFDYRQFRFSRVFGSSPEMALQDEPFAKPVEVLEYWGRVPSEFTTDGKTERVVTIANGQFLLRDRPNPFWSCRKPFLAFSPTPDPHHFFAIGKAEVVAKLQIVANRFTNQQLDVIDRLIDPAFIYNEMMGLDPSRAHLAPNKWIGMSGPIDGNFAPITPDVRGVEMGTAKTQEIARWMQQATGVIDDVVVGIKGAGQDTARGVLTRAEAVAVRLMLEAKLAEKSYLEPLADNFMGLNKQFLETPRELIILGESATQDPITGGAPMMQREILRPQDLIPTYAARGRGAASRMGKGVRQQNLVLLLQACSNNPVIAGAINWLNFFRTIFREFEIENINELIATQEEFQRMQELASGREPATVPGTPGPGNMDQGLPALMGV